VPAVLRWLQSTPLWRLLRPAYRPEEVVLEEHDGTIVALVRGREIGGASAGPSGLAGAWKIVSLRVRPLYRRRGVGRRIIHAAAARAHAAGAPFVYAHVLRTNTASLRAFLSAGFREVPFLHDGCPHGPHDYVTLALRFPPAFAPGAPESSHRSRSMNGP
jgi:ribosomal protein S18 acetylase RimI-like enzyme